MKTLICENYVGIKPWIHKILTQLVDVSLDDIYCGRFKIAFEDSEKIVNQLYRHIIRRISITLPTDSNQKQMTIIRGSSLLSANTVLNKFASIAVYKENFAIIPPYTKIKYIFLPDYSELTNNPFFTHHGNDQRFYYIYKFNYALEFYYESLKPNLIKMLTDHSLSILASLDYHIDIQKVLEMPAIRNYENIVINLQINSSHIQKTMKLLENRFGLVFPSESILMQMNHKLLSNPITKLLLVESIDSISNSRPDFIYTLAPNISLLSEENINHKFVSSIQAINTISEEELNQPNLFSGPFLSRLSFSESFSLFSKHAIPIFDERYFDTNEIDLKTISLHDSETIIRYLKFQPERLFLHLLIVKIYTSVQDAKLLAPILIDKAYELFSSKIIMLVNKIKDIYKEVSILYKDLLETKLISTDTSEYEFTNMYIFKNIMTHLDNELTEILSKLISQNSYKCLSFVKIDEAEARFLVGGCGCGKTTYKKYLNSNNNNQFYNHLVLNIDDLFDLLYRNNPFLDQIIFSEWSFQETILLHHQIFNVLKNISQTGRIPNLYYEGIFLLDSLLDLYKGATIDIISLFTSPEIALSRVFKREGGIKNPLGCYFVLSTYAKNLHMTQKLIQTCALQQLKRFTLTLANTQFSYEKNEKPIVVAKFEFDRKNINIYAFDLFCKYFYAKSVNLFATDMDDIYTGFEFHNIRVNFEQIFNFYSVHFFDSNYLQAYLEIKNKKVQVLDSFLFETNSDPWTFSLLQGILSLDNDNDFNLDSHKQLSVSRFPTYYSSHLANLIYLIKNIQILLYTSSLSENDERTLVKLKENLMIFFENHNFKAKKIKDMVEDAKTTLNQSIHAVLDSYANNYLSCYQNIQVKKESLLNQKLKNPFDFIDTSLPKFFESEFSYQLILHPPCQMMRVLGEISLKIIDSLKKNLGKSDPTIFSYFLARLQNSHAAYGNFTSQPSLQDVFVMLRNNKVNDICQILFIHFVFSDVCYRNFEVFDPIDTGKDNLFCQLWNPQAKTFLNKEEIKEFANVYLYNSPIFQDRHRINRLSPNPICKHDFYHENDAFSSDHGILNSGLLSFFGKSPCNWRQDRFFSTANLEESRLAKEMFHAEVPYVSSFSGMTTLFLPCALLAGKINKQIDIAYYLLALCAYLAYSGLHSWHEVLSVGQYRLNLLTTIDGDYHVDGADIGNIHYFLKILNDIEIWKLRNTVWTKLYCFFSISYLDRFNLFSHQKQSFSILSHNEFIQKMTILDLDKLRIKLCELQIQKYIECNPIKSYTMIPNHNIFLIIKELVTVLNTSTSLIELDNMLRKFDNVFLKYIDKFSYQPRSVWNDIQILLTKKYKISTEFETDNNIFMNNVANGNDKSSQISTIGYAQHIFFLAPSSNSNANTVQAQSIIPEATYDLYNYL